MASQLFVDLYGCDVNIVNSLEMITTIARDAIREIGADIVEECFHQFEPQGITYIALISTSHFSIHTWPEHGYAAIDIFSCDKAVPDMITKRLKEAFGAKHYQVKAFERDIEGRDSDWNLR